MMKKQSGKDREGAAEDKKTDWEKEAKTAEDRYRFKVAMKSMSGDEQVEAMRIARESEMAQDRQASAARTQELENERTQRMQSEKEAAERKAQEEATERKRLEEEKRTNERAELERKQAEMAVKFNQAMEANSPETFLKNYRTWKELQHELNPEEKASIGSNPTVALELKKLELQQAKEDREFKWKMRQDEKQFQIQLETLHDNRDFRRLELAQQAKKDDMFASFPQRIGGAVAKGMLAHNVSGGDEPQSIARKAVQGHHIEIGAGEAGEVPCPTCGTAVGVGHTSQSAVCVGCNSRFKVVRRPRSEPEPSGAINEEEE